MNIDSKVQKIPSVGPIMGNRLKKLGVGTLLDLIYYFPFRYDDYSLTSPISQTQPGEIVTIKGQIISIENIYTKTGKKIQKAVVSDGGDKLFATWFNQPFLVKSLPPGTFISLSGKIEKFGLKKSITSPKYEKLNELVDPAQGNAHTGRLVPIYPETDGISSKWIRSKIVKILPETIDQIEEFLPDSVKKENGLIGLHEAIKQIHFPQDRESLAKARERLGFDEFFEIQINTLFRKKEWKEKKLSHPLLVDGQKVMDFINNLPFKLTGAQNKVIGEILQDLGKNKAMNRLLEGDVGSGKTVVAAIACFVASLNKFQSVLMSPTQILAKQHYKTLTNIFAPLGIKVALVTSDKKTTKDLSGFDLIVGTHALIQKDISLENLALVVVDEQHRFGVEQRALLVQKSKDKTPHILTMTATPIPRTVALIVYGDLDLSVIDEMPIGRQKVKTWVVPSKKREAAYAWIRQHVKDTDEQAFIVCPLIEESDFETMKSVKAVTVEFERLSKKVFADLRLGLLHGRIKPKEKDEQMRKMKDGEIDILVATPVVEVGIDIPTATIMMIEASERFGLAQLHQLRGRVGRGSKQSYCLLFTESQNAIYRLKHLENNYSGAKLAELDLKLRGPGDLYGKAQHGYPELKIGSYSNLELIKKARAAAEKLLPEIDKMPPLKKLLTKNGEIMPN